MEAGAGAAEERLGADAKQIMDKLAERLGKGARAAAVFGEPVEREGVTVIPVAKARWGFGGGAGIDSGDAQEGAGPAASRTWGRGRRGGRGTGGGGGAMVVPAGYIEIKGGATSYRPIVDASTVAIVGTIATAAVLIAWALAAALARRRA